MTGPAGILMMVMADIASLGHYGGFHRQPGRMIVSVPLTDASDKVEKNCT